MLIMMSLKLAPKFWRQFKWEWARKAFRMSLLAVSLVVLGTVISLLATEPAFFGKHFSTVQSNEQGGQVLARN